MDLVADVDARLVEGVEDRPPAPRQLVEGGLDQALGPRRPGIEIGPGERAREGDMGVEAQCARGLGRPQHLLDGPFLARLRIAAHLRCREGVEGLVIGRVHGDELALEMGRELGDLEPCFDRALDLVAIGLAGRGLLEVEQPGVPGRDLHAL